MPAQKKGKDRLRRSYFPGVMSDAGGYDIYCRKPIDDGLIICIALYGQ